MNAHPPSPNLARQLFQGAAPAIALIASLALAGCGSTARVDDNTLTAKRGSPIDGKPVALALRFRQHVWKDPGLYMTGQTPKPGETVTREYDFTRELKDYVIVTDAENNLGTREMLTATEPAIRQALALAGARVTDDPDAPFRLDAEVTFGPTAAPAYADYDLGKSLGMSMLTLGLGPRQYQLREDYALTLRLTDTTTGAVLLERSFRETDAHPHSVSQLDFSAIQRSANAARGLYLDSLEGNLNDFLGAL